MQQYLQHGTQVSIKNFLYRRQESVRRDHIQPVVDYYVVGVQ